MIEFEALETVETSNLDIYVERYPKPCTNLVIYRNELVYMSRTLTWLVLYRHGWGCAPDPEGAVKYLSAAASNSASIEQMALQAGMKKGGAAKGELVLAIFELANCFRHGWGIEKDAYAAKQVR